MHFNSIQALIFLFIILLASANLLGAIIGTLMSGASSYVLGRKKTIMVSQLVTLAGFLIIRFSNAILWFCIGNCLGGYSTGVNIAVMPSYIGEINQPRIRKFTGSFMSLFFTFGFSFAYLIGKFTTWKNTASIVMTLPSLGFFLLLFCPESPTWHMMKGRKQTATSILIKLRGNTDVATHEISKIEENLEKQKRNNLHSNNSSYMKTQLKILTKGTFLRPCSVLIIMFAINWQWTGMPLITFYAVDIVKQFQVPLDPFWLAPGIGCYQFLITLIGVPISSIIPRRQYYIGSAVILFAGVAILGATIHLRKYEFFVQILEDCPELKWLPIVGLILYLLGYELGYITVCYMLLGELLPSNARGIGGSIVVLSNNISFFIAVKTANALQSVIGVDGIFFMFSGVAIFAIIFAYFCIPETFGKSLEEVEEHYRRLCYRKEFEHVRTSNHINLSYMNDEEKIQ